MRPLILVVSAGAICHAFAAEPDNITNAPAGQYSLIQSEPPPDERPTNCSMEGLSCFHTVLRFRDKTKLDVHLAGVGWGYEDKAEYAISPDARWIARHQHTGGGWSVLVLYRVEANGQVWRLDGDLVDLALDCVLADLRRTKKEYSRIADNDYNTHRSADPTMSWNRTSNLLHFEVNASPQRDRPDLAGFLPISQWVDYDPNHHKIIVAKSTAIDAGKAAIQAESWTLDGSPPFIFVENFVRALATNDVDIQLSYYADRVDYYESGQVTKEDIRNDLKHDITKWPNRDYRLWDVPKVARNGDGFLVEFLMFYALADSKQDLFKGGKNHGTLQMAVRFKPRGKTWQVIGIQKKVIDTWSK